MARNATAFLLLCPITMGVRPACGGSAPQTTTAAVRCDDGYRMALLFIRIILLAGVLISGDVAWTAVGLNVPPFSNIRIQELTTQPAEVAATTSASTPYGPMPFDQAGQDGLVRVHNEHRSAVDPPATNMNKVVWSADLAEAAASSLDSCVYLIGDAQLVSSNRWLLELGNYQELNNSLSDILTELYGRGELYDYHQMSCLGNSDFLCAIYKLLTWSSMSAFGCSQHYCEFLTNSYTQETANNMLYWKCLYNNVGYFTNPSLRPYSNGTVNDTCTQCESGSSWCENGLCIRGCDTQSANCTCALDPQCSGNGELSETACECNCTGHWMANSCEQCGLLTCQSNTNLNRELCQCDCLQGFIFNSTTTNCEDVDECQSSHGCEDTCENTLGSYDCTCMAGFRLDADGRTCDPTTTSFPVGSTTETAGTLGSITTDSAAVCDMDIICNGSGVIDPQTCECYCASGYKGSNCNEQCSLTDTKCWLGYRKPGSIIDADHCPVYCFECACDPSEANCENNGTYTKVPGYELKYGMCRCYCPFPWSGLTCQECNVSCFNGGTLDDSTCTCTCPAGFSPPNCRAECKPDISRWCTRGMAPYCDRITVIRKNCPVLCGTCAV